MNTSDIASGESKNYCLCGKEEFGRMIACENLYCSLEWFHYECVGITRKPKGNGIVLLAKIYY